MIWVLRCCLDLQSYEISNQLKNDNEKKKEYSMQPPGNKQEKHWAAGEVWYNPSLLTPESSAWITSRIRRSIN